MNKTRMGKRAASLLLSLVMMLSLLPTAAYATMADGVDTQGAIVSENGTDVSDDSNSSGGTGDLQVEDSENSGNTGDQQVGGSSGSGTADDTTGAEGGADPTDSVNGNDSADPQDDGDAVMPVASSVVSTSEELVAAIAAANDGDTITLGEGEFTTYGNTSPEKSLTFVGAGTGTVWTIGDLDKDVGGEGNGDYSFEGCDTITFKNMTLKVDNKNYRGFIRINHTVVENCTLEGRTAYWGYETAKFVGSTFTAPEGDYALWDYSTKDMSFDGCKFNISGKGVHVYVEAANADKDVTRTVAVNNCTVNSTKANKAFLNIKNSTQSYDVTLSGTNTVNGLTADGTTGSALYQVETTEVTETTGNPVTVKQANTAGELETVYEVKQPSANVAKVGDTEYATLDKAIAALSSSSYTLQLLDKSAWNEATPVYWAAGSESGYAATLADALTAAYKANGDITIVCRPGTDVGKLTHGHVADDITIYGNNAYISGGECELEVDTYMFSRDTGKQVTTGGAYLEKNITVTAYELDNLGVWGQRHTDHKVTVNLTDCDSVNGITVQRVYISGTTGVNDITLTGCDFATKATSVYSNADGAVVIDNCSFTGAQVPVNFNHKANGTQTVTVKNSAFTNYGDNGDWKQFAAPVRFVNSGSGTMTTSVNTCTFTDTVGGNGDILLGDGRVGEKSNDVKLTVENTAANVQAQQPGYYAKDGTTDESKQGTKNVAASDTLTTSVTQLMPSSETTSVAEVNGDKYDSLQAAIDKAGRKATVRLLADTRENVTISTNYLTLDLNGHTLNGGTEKGKPALTVTARVTVKDSSAAKTGTIMREDTAENSGVRSHYVIDIQDGWLFFESGNVTNNSGVVGVKGASLVRVGDDSVAKYPGLTISGGTFTQDNFIVIKVDRGTFYLKEDGTLNSKNSYAVENWKFAEIKGGTVNGTVAAWTYSGGHNSDLTISGGTVNGNVASVSYDKAEGKVAKVSITGGTVTGTLGTYTYGNGLIPINDATKATIAVTGGTFKEDPTKYVVEDSAITPNADGTYGVAKAYLAKVGDTSYYTMDEAFKAQTASSKDIVLLRDYTTGSTFNSGSINRTVDLNGHTWTCTGTDANSAAFEINYPDATLTVKNGKVVSSQLVGLIPSAMGGTITYDNSTLVFDGVVMTTTAHSGIETNGNNSNDTVTLRNSTLNVPNGFGIYFPSSGTLTIDNSVINAKTMGVQVCSGSLNISGADTAINVSGDGIDKTINDGAIEDGAAISIVNRAGYKDLAEIKVEGGKFTAKGDNAAVKAYDWANQTENAFTQAAKVSISGGTFSSAVDKSLCADGYIPTQNGDGTYGVEIGMFTVMVTSRTTGSNSPVANVAGGGSNITYAQGTTVTASAISGYKFVGWFVNEYTGTPYSTDLTCEVKPTDDCTMIAVYEPISGGVFALEVSASKFTVNGGATQRSYLLEKMPVGTQVTVVFKGSENFLYWVNESGKVVSTSKTYAFSMGSATTLKAVYAEKEENQAMVVFISHTQQVISSKGYTDTQEIQFPEPPIKMGATFVRWSMTEAEIRAAMATTATGIIVVEPVYKFSAGSYTVTVNYPNDETETYTATVGKITTVTAKSIDGKVFKCWKNGDTVLGYTETLRIAPRGNLTLTAEYVDAGTTVDRLPVIALTEISASQQGAKYAVSFTATRSVPDGYTVTEQGVLVSTDSRYGEAGALDAMKLDADGDEPDNTKSLKATNTDATGVTVLNGIVSAADRTVYGRAYMILRDSSGAMVYVYSDTILSGSYNSLTTNGGN